MKRILLFVLIICNFTTLFSQEQSIVPSTDLPEWVGLDEKNKYMIGYHKNGKQKYIWSTGFIHQMMHEGEVIGTGPWQGNVTILPSSMNYEIIAKEVLKPYYKIADSCSIQMAVFYDLNGNFLKFELEIPAEVNIPVEVIEELDSRLKKESKLQLEYDPEKAKYVNYITLSTTPILQRYEDDCLKIEYEKADSNTYVIKRYDPNTKYISNIDNPYEGIGTAEWRGRIKELSFLVTPITIAKEVLTPYCENPDWCYIRGFYDLNGDLQYFILSIPAKVNIPVKVIEKLEYRLKKEVKMKLEYDPERVKYVNYIRFP